MTQRSLSAGNSPTVNIRTGADVQVEGWDDDRVLAETTSRWGLKVERHSGPALGRIRARARVGDRVLFDLHTDIVRLKKTDPGEEIEVEIGGSGTVRVPRDSRVKVYAGQRAEVRGIQGSVAVYAGGDVHLQDIRSLVHVTAGGALDAACETLAEDKIKFQAGRDLRLYVRDLTDAKIKVNDLGGYWEGVMGNGRYELRLQAGGDVTWVTDQPVKGQPPDYVLGHIETPGSNYSQSSGLQ